MIASSLPRLAAMTSLVLLFISGATGQNLIVKHSGVPDSLRKYPQNSTVVELLQGSKSISSTSVRQDENVRYIVELSSPPRKSPMGRATEKNSVAVQQQASFLNSLNAVASSSTVSYRYSEILNAIAISVPRSSLPDIVRLPGVTRVFEDKKVRGLTLEPSGREGRTSATLTADTSGGKGIRVGVIDTGIDYLHEAFGGGFGPGFTVEGGYNFVGSNDDPRDDNGHGTEVAGIIAGNSGQLRGVAPKARLYAYKVLDAEGNGNTSDVIAAIERAIIDSVKVINLSLGTPEGDPDDILSHAVDLAVQAGLVVVVAAGNNGDYGTIDSPGSAREALTVGATDLHNAVASFSSRGPSNKIYGIKPDIVAPGESILSAKMNGGYAAMSGTSIAAPYISGMAAILREYHPGWSASEIRDELIGATADIGESVFAEGKGKLDTAKLARVGAVVSPAAISFGFDPPANKTWVKDDTLMVVNLGNEAKTYTLVTAPSAGISVVISPGNLALAAGDREPVIVHLEADNSVLADNAVYPQGYGGKILAVSQTDTLVIPYVFFKGSLFQFTFSETPFQVVIHDRKDKAYYYNPTGPFLSAFVPPGVYDIVTAFSGSAFVVRENISTVNSPTLAIGRAEASHEVTIFPTDENDSALVAAGPHTTYSYIEALRQNSSGISMLVLGGGPVSTPSLEQHLAFSDMSANYSFGFALNVQYANARSYTYDVDLDTGITAPLNVSFGSSEFKRVDFKYDVDSTTPRIFPVLWSAFAPSSGLVAVTYFDGDSPPLRYPFIQTGYYTKRAKMGFPILHYREAYRY